MSESDVVIAIVAALPGIIFVAAGLIRAKVEREEILAKQKSDIAYLNNSIGWIRDEMRCLMTEIDYHLHDGAHNVLCDAARDWRDDDISRAYFSSNGRERLGMAEKTTAPPPGMYCRYCHMRLSPTDLTCSHCGAQVLDADAIRLWSGK
jgi:hypothetical protein